MPFGIPITDSGSVTVTHRVVVELPHISQLGAMLMSKFDDIMAKLNDLEAAQTAAEERETAEDASAAQRDADSLAAITALQAQVADLQAQIAAGGLSDAEENQILQRTVDLPRHAQVSQRRGAALLG